MHQKSLFHYKIKIRGVYRMANVSKEMLLVLMVAAVAVVGLVLLIQNNLQISLTGQAFSVGSDSKMKSTATLPTLTKPDFYVKWIHNIGLVYDPDSGSKMTFLIEIGNKGKSAGQINKFTLDVFAYNAETVPGWDKGKSFSNTETIAAGSTIMVEEEMDIPDEWIAEVLNGYSQDIDVEVYVDSGTNIAESDETNNAYAQTLQMNKERITIP